MKINKTMHNFDELVEYAKTLETPGIAVVLPYDRNTLLSAKDALDAGLAAPELFGNASKIKDAMNELDMAENTFPIRDTGLFDADAITSAVASVKTGSNKILMKGKISTGVLLKAALDKTNGLNAGRLASHLVVMSIPGFDRLIISSDGGLNIAPDLSAKADILKNAVDVAKALGITSPKAAILAAVETVNPKMQATIDAACLCKMADRGSFGDAIVEGPLAIDNVLSAEAAKKKGINSPVCGAADIIISPSIETANVFNKTLNHLLHSQNAGIIAGTKAPIILPSRAGDVKSKYASIALSVLMSAVH